RIASLPGIDHLTLTAVSLEATIRDPQEYFPEEQRSRQWSVFSVLRMLVELFFCPDEPNLGLYGAFGYDLAFQFDKIEYVLPRPQEKRDLVLFLPDALLVVDHRKQKATRYLYEFRAGDESTEGLPRIGASFPYQGRAAVQRSSDHAPGEFAA